MTLDQLANSKHVINEMWIVLSTNLPELSGLTSPPAMVIALTIWLGIRDSNPNCLIQSQVCCRCTNSQNVWLFTYLLNDWEFYQLSPKSQLADIISPQLTERIPHYSCQEKEYSLQEEQASSALICAKNCWSKVMTLSALIICSPARSATSGT